MGAAAPVSFPIRRLADGERIHLGDRRDGVMIEVLATPGHTPESITLAVYEHACDTAPAALLTGDTLFLGDVGRPDLLGSAGRTVEEMARELYRSLRTRILPLPDEVLVYPGHGAGSACGKALSSQTVSTPSRFGSRSRLPQAPHRPIHRSPYQRAGRRQRSVPLPEQATAPGSKPTRTNHIVEPT